MIYPQFATHNAGTISAILQMARAKGAKFDPHQHQAMMEQPSTEVAAGGVIQVLQPGYELFGRNVRPAMVVVAAKGSTGEAAGEPQAQNPYAASDGEDAGAAVDRRA